MPQPPFCILEIRVGGDDDPLRRRSWIRLPPVLVALAAQTDAAVLLKRDAVGRRQPEVCLCCEPRLPVGIVGRMVITARLRRLIRERRTLVLPLRHVCLSLPIGGEAGSSESRVK